MRAVMAVVASFALVMPALADVTVIDGDSIQVDGMTYRLGGIDAPEYRQSCADGFPAGVMASDVLRNLVDGKTVTCEPLSTDRFGQTAVCRADGLDLGAMMVRSGWAWAFTPNSSDYVQHEAEARAAKVGVHDHNCQKPWEWRRKQGTGEPSEFPQDTSRRVLKIDVHFHDCMPARVQVSPWEGMP